MVHLENLLCFLTPCSMIKAALFPKLGPPPSPHTRGKKERWNCQKRPSVPLLLTRIVDTPGLSVLKCHNSQGESISGCCLSLCGGNIDPWKALFATGHRVELDRSMGHCEAMMIFFFNLKEKRTIFWSELCHAAAFFVTRSLLRIITRVHIDVAMTYRALVSTNTDGAPKNFEGDFLGFRKSTFRPFSKSSTSDGFYPIGSKFGTKMAKHVFSKTVLRFSPWNQRYPNTRQKRRGILQTSHSN